MNISALSLKQITGLTSTIDRIYPHLIEAMSYYEIDTTIRICHFLAQVIHESGTFRYMEEIASGEAYEGRKDLGNVNPGDGVKFKGRGLIQITGRFNYNLLSRDFGVDFINKPELLASDQYACLSAGWYWNRNNLNERADNDDLVTITKRINGGLSGEDQRLAWLNKCKKVLDFKDFPDIQ
jgi:putative chitinase